MFDTNDPTQNGNCDICEYGLLGECHLQCTHPEKDEDWL